MQGKPASAILLFLLLVSTIVLAHNIPPVKSDYAWTQTIYIQADGSIQPPTAPISSVDNVTYTLTDNIVGNVPNDTNAINVQRNNTIIDGAGHTLQGTNASGSWGINLSGISNVTIKNMKITVFDYGIFLGSSSNNNVSGNIITTNTYGGIGLYSSSNNNSVSGNNITANNYGILQGSSSSNNSVSGNTITTNNYGIWFWYSFNNSINRNNITSNGLGIGLDSWSKNNSVSGNTITANSYGIQLSYYSNNNSMSGNNITANSVAGIFISSSSYNDSVSGNTITNNLAGVWLDSSSNDSVSGNSFVNDGLWVSDSYGSVVTSNSVNGKPLVYLEEVSNYAVGDAGQVVLVKCNNITVENLNLSHTTTGIELWETNNTMISGNNITANNGDGIYLYSSSNNSVSGNNVTANAYDGICLESSSSYNTVSGNTATANSQGIVVDTFSNNNAVSGNTATNNTYCGVVLYSSSNSNTVGGNNFTANGEGIYLYSSNNNTVSWNNATANTQGIWLDSSSSYNTVSGNTATANSQYGIELNSSSNNSVSGNTITNNGFGIYLYSSSNDTIYHNNFINNTSQAYRAFSANVWDNGYPSGGNYWSDYHGTDSFTGPKQNIPGSDGIGDTPYTIDDSAEMDHYPLMQPWSYSQSTTSISISPNPVVVGRPVTCTATLSGSRLTGTVTWGTSSIGGNFNQSVCTLSNGTCSTTYTDNFTGSITIAAYYSGDSNNAPSSGSTTLLVTSNGPVYYSQNYTSVQAAINAAPSGATVIIAPGFYNESLTINKRLTIIGEKDLPVFGGGASSIYLTLLSGASGSTVTGIEVTNFQEGILVDNASHVSIYRNIMASMGGSGIVFEGSSATGNVVFDNVFQDTPTPINLTGSAGGNTVYGNIITSQANVTLNIGANGNVVYGNSMSANQITLNMTNSNGNIFYYNNFMANAQLTVLTNGNNTWDNGYPSGGNYWSNYAGVDVKSGPNQDQPGSDGIGDTPYTIGSNNTDDYPLMKPWAASVGHCVAVISVVAAKTVIGQGFNCSLTVCAADKGNCTESFSVTAYANATGVGTQQVSGLNASCQMVLGFAWNTSGLAYGNYTVNAYAQPVAGQIDVSGNDFTLGTVKVTIPGDINGDFKVSVADLVLLANAYGSKPGDTKWNPNADIDGNRVVGLSDLVIMAYYYGQHYP